MSDGIGRHDVVKNVFPHAISLLEFCTAIVEPPIALLQELDSNDYSNLLHKTLVIPPVADLGLLKKFNVTKVQSFPIGETIGRFVSQCVRGSATNFRELNCLALGYKTKSVNSDATLRASNNTEVHFVNTVQSFVTTQHWQAFANRVGIELLEAFFAP